MQSSDIRPYAGDAWRLVEAQYIVSTLRIVDGLSEQKTLEEILEAGKPDIPEECSHLDFLLYTPFRYRPAIRGSRFRRSGSSLGVFYCAENELTAVAETAFYRLLFYAESPALPWASGNFVFTSFKVSLLTDYSVSLNLPSLNSHANLWGLLEDYSHCQALADKVRATGGDLIAFKSVRDRKNGLNLAVLKCRVFDRLAPIDRHTWHFRIGAFGVQAICPFPNISCSYPPNEFVADNRIARMNWTRTTV